MGDRQVEICAYKGGDRDAVHRIAADTAFFGEPVENFLEDRRFFIDLLYRYYTQYEIDHIWVARGDGSVIAFLTGCPDSTRHRKLMAWRCVPALLVRWATGRYRIGWRTLRHYRRLVGELLDSHGPGVDLRQFPAHMHINVCSGWRGHGIGRRLMEAYFDQLRQEDIPGVHLYTTSHNVAACRLYSAMGMQMLFSRPTLVWDQLISEKIENRAYGLRLS